MSTSEISAALRSFVDRHMTTVDHVAVLVSLHNQHAEAQTSAGLANASRLDREVVDRVLADLVDSHLVRREGPAFVYAPPPLLGPVVDELAHMYRTMPVTLIRAIYARPARAARSFANAFRLRKGVE